MLGTTDWSAALLFKSNRCEKLSSWVNSFVKRMCSDHCRLANACTHRYVFLLQAKSITGDPSGPYRCIEEHELTTTCDEDCSTLDELFQKAVRTHGTKSCFGCRPYLGEEDEAQSNGKVFKKVGSQLPAKRLACCCCLLPRMHKLASSCGDVQQRRIGCLV